MTPVFSTAFRIQMKISILIHNLNRAAVLAPCLRSVLQQNYRPLEVVILDAGSRDESGAVIADFSEQLRNAGISIMVHDCPRLGVAASRNLAARLSTGDLLCAIDNDATFLDSDGVTRAAELFQSNARLGLLSFRVLKANTAESDRSAWVFRRPCAKWFDRAFSTFTFAGTGFCVRADAYWQAGGFWDHLQYSREEEDLGMTLIDQGWELAYSPYTTIRHYSDGGGRSTIADRRCVELRNGILVLWRRLPLPLAVPAIAGRVCSMGAKSVLRREQQLYRLLGALPEAFRDWHANRLRRLPITLRGVWRYTVLHFAR
jgi:glycosyltransferase involved in cell wall biosynthesis